MKKMRLTLVLSSLLLCVFALAPAVATGTTEVPKVGLLWDTLHVERRVTLANLLRDRAKADGWEAVFQSANYDDKLQITQGEAMISQGVKLLVISPVNMDTASAIVNSAKQAGIKVIALDRLIKGCRPDFFVGFNNDAVGDEIATWAVQHAPKGNYALICGDPADNNAVLYRDGYYRVLKPYIDRGDIKVVVDQYCAGWDGAVALKIAEQTLTANNNNIQVFLSQNDGMANGCVQALQEQGLVGKVLVTGQDGELSALQRIVEGKQSMSVWKSSEALAALAADTIKAMLTGKAPKTNVKVNNGVIDIPGYFLDAVSVDKSNVMTTVIAAGAQKEEDVYANIPRDQWPKK